MHLLSKEATMKRQLLLTGQISREFLGRLSPSPSKDLIAGKWSAKPTAKYSSPRTGNFRRTVIRSTTTSPSSSPTGRNSTCTTCTSERQEGQNSTAHGKARAKQ